MVITKERTVQAQKLDFFYLVCEISAISIPNLAYFPNRNRVALFQTPKNPKSKQSLRRVIGFCSLIKNRWNKQNIWLQSSGKKYNHRHQMMMTTMIRNYVLIEKLHLSSGKKTTSQLCYHYFWYPNDIQLIYFALCAGHTASIEWINLSKCQGKCINWEQWNLVISFEFLHSAFDFTSLQICDSTKKMENVWKKNHQRYQIGVNIRIIYVNIFMWMEKCAGERRYHLSENQNKKWASVFVSSE